MHSTARASRDRTSNGASTDAGPRMFAPAMSWRSESAASLFVRSRTMLASETDPWVQTIRLLSSGSQASGLSDRMPFVASPFPLFNQDAALRNGPSLHLAISLIERTSTTSVTIAWRDATSCFYGAQVWSAAKARLSGVCAISGARIKRGDRIFHPRRSKPAPVNAKAMILASTIDAVEPVGTHQ
jgi:hypothetical protein